jgi:hypothetical protein
MPSGFADATQNHQAWRRRGPHAPGRPPRTPCDYFRGKAFYNQMAADVARKLGKPAVSADDLGDMYRPHEGAPRSSKVWHNYKSGEDLPSRSGKRTNHIDAARLDHPAAEKWLDHLLWVAADCLELTLPQIHGHLLTLPERQRYMLMIGSADTCWLRVDTNVPDIIETLMASGSLDDLVTAILLLREAELLQRQVNRMAAYDGMCRLLPVLEAVEALQPFAAEFATYAKHVFKHPWYLVPHVYWDHPSNYQAAYPGYWVAEREYSQRLGAKPEARMNAPESRVVDRSLTKRLAAAWEAFKVRR